MQFLSKAALTLATLSFAAADDTKYLAVKSDNTKINGNILGFTHEGAGINYGFLGTGDSTVSLTFDKDAGTLSQPFIQSYYQFLSVDSGFVALTVGESTAKFSFDSDNTLLVNGTSNGFYACKNTGDPYDYSVSSYELMYYTSDAPSDCISLTVVDDQKFADDTSSGSSVAPSSSSVAPSSSVQSTHFSVESTSSTIEATSFKVPTTSVEPSSTLKVSSTGSKSSSVSVTPVSTAKNDAVSNIPSAAGAAGAAVFGLLVALF